MLTLRRISEKLAALGRDPEDPARSNGQRAAVAAILREGADGEGAELFFIRRAESANDPWSGHIAFPGGRRDPGDATLLATALRETREEVGIDLARADFVGRLPDVAVPKRTAQHGLVVTPFVFLLREYVTPVPNYEVGGTMWVSLAQLVRGEGRGTYSFDWEGNTYDLPCVRLGSEQHVLWGMTYRMLESMLEVIG